MKTCDESAATSDDLLIQLESKYKEKGQEAAWKLERDTWKDVLKELMAKEGIGFNYRIERLLGLGGAAAVFRIIDCNLFSDMDGGSETPDDLKKRRSFRALKIPRPHVEKGPTLADSLREEISRLTALSHPNVVSLYAKGQIPINLVGEATTWPWYIMSYVHKATDLGQLCADAPPPFTTLIRYLFDVAKGLQYVHKNNVVHCDVKPGNIFVTSQADNIEPARAILADFGYAKHLSDPHGETTIGFTDYFAHPDLQVGALRSSRGSRTFTKLNRKEVRPAFDLFAFGMSIHFLLETFYNRYSVYSVYSYEIKYLKLCAARLLDGLNHQKAITYAKLPYYCFKDTGLPNSESFVAGIKYHAAEELVDDLAKLVGEFRPEVEICELIENRRENIQVSDVAPVIYTDRLRHLVEHPLIRRLASTTQLGLVSLVYPGAKHSRLEHSLGTLGIAAKYILSLYNDMLDPLFRQLIGTRKMKATLLAALFHDIGQFPLAHDLEDVSMEFFSHTDFGRQLLSLHDPADVQGRLFENPMQNCKELVQQLAEIVEHEWGVKLEEVKAILDARNSESTKVKQIGSHSNRLCKSLIDGPIDADKLDYLQRDSRHCNVKYGFGIDTDRLFRCLTIAHSDIKEDHLLLVIGAHEKGRISAESVLFARYAMLTQVYWQHTMRTIKAMLHHATAEFLSKLNDNEFATKRREFLEYAIFGRNIDDLRWNELIAKGTAVAHIHEGDIRVLGWLWLHTTASGRSAIEHLLNRQLFKRILVIYRSELTEKQRQILEKVFKPDRYKDRVALREAIEKALLVKMKSSPKPSLALVETQGFTREQWEQRLQDMMLLHCLVDYPATRSGAAFGLQIIRQWGERPTQASPEVLEPTELYPTIIPMDNFRDGMKELEKSIACLRIFWRPDEDTLLRETLGHDGIREVVLEELTRFTVEE
jgi:HD superfamily phosphohydrolase